MNYDGKRFRPVSTSENSEVGMDLIFEYQQKEDVLTCSYSGGNIKEGHLIALVTSEGVIEMHYHQFNLKGILMTGTCTSTPELLEDGRIRLHEKWQWTNGDQSKGESTLEEIT
jgi:hypothetical protein